MCRVCVVEGDGLLKYSFPAPHPFSSKRVTRFWEELRKEELGEVAIEPELADEEEVELFHDKGHFDYVRNASKLGRGFLDGGDTPAFKGILEAAEFTVGSTLSCVEKTLSGEVDHGFNPVGGLHHARPDRSAGFCVFNDIGVAIERLRKEGVNRVLYVDIDVHHGDGVFYPFEYDRGVFIFDVHEDGHFLYPGTGNEGERGAGGAEGTKMNLALLPGEGDETINGILHRLEEFAVRADPQFVILQCGADSLAGDPIGGLKFSERFHSSVARTLHEVAHRACDGRIVALGGGGYDPNNCARAWTSVVRELVSGEES